MNFTDLVSSIRLTHQILQEDTVKAVNRNLTVRNWLLGYYIVTYEQGGKTGPPTERAIAKAGRAIG